MNFFNEQFLIWSLLISLLGNNDFRTRNNVQTYFEKNPNIFVFATENKEDLETHRRIYLLKSKYKEDMINKWFENKHLPWIFLTDDIEIRQKYLYDSRNRAVDNPMEFEWDRWRKASELFFKDMLFETMDFNRAEELIDHWYLKEHLETCRYLFSKQDYMQSIEPEID